MGRSFREALSDEICAYKPHLTFGIAISVVFILLSFISLTVVGPESGAYYIAILNIGTLVGVIGICLAAVLYCDRQGY